MSRIDEEFALLQALLHSHQNDMIKKTKAMHKALDKLQDNIYDDIKGINDVVDELAAVYYHEESKFTSKLKRKEMAIKGLQATLRNRIKDKNDDENKFVKSENDNKLIENGEKSEINLLKKEIKALKEEIQALKAKVKAKGRKIRQYKLTLADYVDDEYREDVDEEDGDPSEDSSGVDDIEMDEPVKKAPADVLLEESETDPDDSEYDPDEETEMQSEAGMLSEVGMQSEAEMIDAVEVNEGVEIKDKEDDDIEEEMKDEEL